MVGGEPAHLELWVDLPNTLNPARLQRFRLHAGQVSYHSFE